MHKPAAPTESTQAYFVAVQNQDIQQVFNLNPTSPQLPRTPAAISFDRFRATSDVAYERLAASYPLLCSQGSAVVTNSSVEQDYDVLDGVLPYYPPRPPLNTPDTKGTRGRDALLSHHKNDKRQAHREIRQDIGKSRA